MLYLPFRIWAVERFSQRLLHSFIGHFQRNYCVLGAILQGGCRVLLGAAYRPLKTYETSGPALGALQSVSHSILSVTVRKSLYSHPHGGENQIWRR